MAKKHLLHVKSSTVTNGSPKLPLPADIEYGEIAINYADGYETISIKNSNNEIVSFPNMNIIHDNEEVVAAALANEEDARIAGDSALSSSLSSLSDTVSALADDVETLHINDNLKEVTYSELLQMVNEATLIPGTFYRITDYTTVVAVSERFMSAGHQFDIIVQALSANTISEDASAISHEGETYFNEDVPFYSGDVCKMWKLKYTLINDATKYDWVNTQHNVQKKGVIYYMKDEWGNEAPYDFKNIMFRRRKVTSLDPTYFYDDPYGSVAGSVKPTSGRPYALGYIYDENIFPYGAILSETDEWYYTFSGIAVNTYTSWTIQEQYVEISNADYANLNSYEQGLYIAKDAESYAMVTDYRNLTDDDYQAISANLENIAYDNKLSITDYTIYDMSTHPQYYFEEMLGRPSEFMKETCAGNIIRESWSYDNIEGIYSRKRFRLPENVFIGFPNKVIEATREVVNEYEDPEDPGTMLQETTTVTENVWLNNKPCNIVSNTIGYGSFLNTFAGDSENNVFEENCSGNILCENASNNHFGVYCYSNILGLRSCGNSLGANSYDNNFGVDCNYNTTGKEFRGNVLNYNSNYNTFGDYFVMCFINGAYNRFGNWLYNNTVITSYSTFGNRISDCKIGNIDTTTTPFTVIDPHFLDLRGDNYKCYVYSGFCTLSIASTHITIPENANRVTVLSGVYQNQAVSNKFVLNVDYPQYVGFDSNGNVAVWCPADHLLPSQNP